MTLQSTVDTSAFVSSKILSAGRRHAEEVVDILHFIERLEELHTEVQEMITSSHLATEIIYNIYTQWSLYLNMCVEVSSSEGLGVTRATVPFLVELILLELEVRLYVGPISPVALVDLVRRRHRGSDGGSGGSGGKGGGVSWRWDGVETEGTGGGARMWVQYNAHLTFLSLRNE